MTKLNPILVPLPEGHSFIYRKQIDYGLFIEEQQKIWGCSRLALNFTPFSQGFKLHFRCPNVKPKFTFLQE